jgi:hypothetical protein
LSEAAICTGNDQAIISSNVLADSGEHIPDGFTRLFVLTSGPDLIIEAVSIAPEFIVVTDADYRIHSLIYDPTTLDLSSVVFGETSAVEVNSLLLQGGGTICAALDVTGVLFSFGGCDSSCLADAGTLSPSEDFVCFPNNPHIQAEIQDAPLVPPGFSVIYVLTRTNGLIIEGVSNTPEFTVQEAGNYRIHTLVYDPTTLDLSIVEFGVTTGFDVNGLLQQGGGDICGALDVAGAAFHVGECTCDADFGFIFPITHDCLDGSADLEALVVVPPTVPVGFEVIYVLTSGNDLVIEAVNTSPEFTVEESGIYTIHTLVYDPATLDLGIVEFGVTTGFDVNGLLQQGGGDICAVLDVTGAHFNVEECVCEADFSDLIPLGHDCLDGSIFLRTIVLGQPTVPAGFEVIYVLTSGDELIIEAVNNFPIFTVTEPGFYTIHSLIYDPTTLDLDIVEFGVTTGFDINGLLQQGGGNICAALDVEGASFNVEECSCTAETGHIAPSTHDCLDGSANLEAITLIPPTIPAGFEVIYVLTSGDELIIEAVNASPEFTVEETGIFTIHTLVYDPTTLDLGIVEFGVTTGFDVNGLLQQGGGDICAVLDVAGAHFDVEECPCEAEAGILKKSNDPCLENSDVLIDFEEFSAPVIPNNYEVLYVLTSGNDFIIEQVSTETEFTVNSTGRFTAHTLVYNPATLDLSIVEFGVTSAFTVNSLLIQGGGDICAALDLAGLVYDIETCNSPLQAAIFFPNPVQDELQIQVPETYLEQGMQVSILSIGGQLIKTVLMEEPQGIERINVEDLPSGTYQIILEGVSSGYQVEQVVKF